MQPNNNNKISDIDKIDEKTRFFDEKKSYLEMVLNVNDATPQEIYLKNNEPLSIGRYSHNDNFLKPDIRVVDLYVSRGHHVIITRNNDLVDIFIKEGKTGLKMNDKHFQMNESATNLKPPVHFTIGESVDCSINFVDPEQTRLSFNNNLDVPIYSSPNREQIDSSSHQNQSINKSSEKKKKNYLSNLFKKK